MKFSILLISSLATATLAFQSMAPPKSTHAARIAPLNVGGMMATGAIQCSSLGSVAVGGNVDVVRDLSLVLIVCSRIAVHAENFPLDTSEG